MSDFSREYEEIGILVNGLDEWDKMAFNAVVDDGYSEEDAATLVLVGDFSVMDDVYTYYDLGEYYYNYLMEFDEIMYERWADYEAIGQWVRSVSKYRDVDEEDIIEMIGAEEDDDDQTIGHAFVDCFGFEEFLMNESYVDLRKFGEHLDWTGEFVWTGWGVIEISNWGTWSDLEELLEEKGGDYYGNK